MAIDSAMKAEAGHWIVGFQGFVSLWFEELMDRMNISGYTERVVKVWGDCPENLYPPEVRAFISGGYFLVSGKKSKDKKSWRIPLYPQNFPIKSRFFIEQHEIAEYLEKWIRNRVLILSKDCPWEAFRIYGLVCKQVALLNLQGRTKIEILGGIASFDPKKVSESDLDNQIRTYGLLANNDWKGVLALGVAAVPALSQIVERGETSRAISAIESLYEIAGSDAEDGMVRALRHKNYLVRGFAAEMLIKYKKIKLGEAGYDELNAHELIRENGLFRNDWTEIIQLGNAAIPALEAALSDELREARVGAAEALIKIRNLKRGTNEYDRLNAHRILIDWNGVDFVDFGKDPYVALLTALKDESNYFAGKALKAAKFIQDENLIRGALRHEDFYVRSIAAQTLIDMRKYDRKSPEYLELYAYTLSSADEGLLALGKSAIPALLSALDGNEWQVQSNAIFFLQKIFERN